MKGIQYMKIAVAYDCGKIYEGTGRPNNFKVYQIENKSIINDMVCNAEGSGRASLVAILVNSNIDVVLCNVFDSAAKNMLQRQGIRVVDGISGNADEEVLKYIKIN